MDTMNWVMPLVITEYVTLKTHWRQPLRLRTQVKASSDLINGPFDVCAVTTQEEREGNEDGGGKSLLTIRNSQTSPPGS